MILESLNAVVGAIWTNYRGCLIEKKSENEFMVLRFHVCGSLEEAKAYIDESLKSFGKNFIS